MIKSKHVLLAVVFLLRLALPAPADTSVKRLAPGVTLTQEMDKTTPLLINVLSVDLTAPGVRVGVGIGQDRISGADPTKGREDVSRYVRRHGVLAAVNADFFPYTGDPLGVGIKDGELFSEPWPGNTPGQTRVAFALSADGKSAAIDNVAFLGDLQASDGARYFLSGINRPVGPGEIVAFTSLYGVQTAFRRGGCEVVISQVNLPVRANKLIAGRVVSVNPDASVAAVIPSDSVVLSAGPGAGSEFLLQHCHVGQTAGFVLSVTPAGQTHDGIKIASLPRSPGDLPSREGSTIARGAYFWANVKEAVGGGPRLLANGIAAIDTLPEGFNSGFSDSPNPRTAIGITRDSHHIIIVTVDGRQPLSRGVTLLELAAIMRRYGAWNAMNFDGGGSTVMTVAGLTVSSPSGTGQERPVADMLTVDSANPVYTLPRFTDPGALTASLTSVDAPGPSVIVGSTSILPVPGGSSRALWQGSVGDGVGFVNQKGYFTALKPGQGTIIALARGQLYASTITVRGKEPTAHLFAIHAGLTDDPEGADNRSALSVRLLDLDNASKAGAPVQLVVTGGAADSSALTTNADGTASTTITWNESVGGSVLLLSPGLAPVTLLQPKKTSQ